VGFVEIAPIDLVPPAKGPALVVQLGKAAKRIDTGVSVYRGVDEAGEVVYYGISNDVPRRARQHKYARRGFQVESLDDLEGLTRAEARAVEQALLVRSRNAGRPLENKINAVSPSRWDYYDQVAIGEYILRFHGYP